MGQPERAHEATRLDYPPRACGDNRRCALAFLPTQAGFVLVGRQYRISPLKPSYRNKETPSLNLKGKSS